MERIIPLKINDKNILVQKESERYIPEKDIKEVIEDIIENNLDFPQDQLINLENICDKMFSIIYKGIITTIEKINEIEIPIENIIFKIC